jgi:hypothetical protein
MNELQLAALIVQALMTGLAARGVTGVTIKQRYQPTAQGTPSNPTIYFQKISSWRYGYPRTSDLANQSPGVNAHVETFNMIVTYQINATCVVDPTNVNALTAGDYVELAVDILQSYATRIFLKNSNVGLFRIVKGRITYFGDDKDRFEADPSYDCSFSYQRVITSTVPSTATIIGSVTQVN